MESIRSTTGGGPASSAFSWLYLRENGVHRQFIRYNKKQSCNLTKSALNYHLWSSLSGKKVEYPVWVVRGGSGVFGLKYSSDGSILVAACENKSLILVDPLTEKVIKLKENAHRDCCNNITFIDDRMFASCSDDRTVAVWDVRNLRTTVFLLSGHMEWVKNVEYHRPSKLLVSSGFDDHVLSWNLNNVNADNHVGSSLVLTAKKLIRMRLSPAGESMYLSCANAAEIVAIHNLNLGKVIKDVEFILCTNSFSYPTIVTNRLSVPADMYFLREKQSGPMSRRNHVDFYKSYIASMHGALGDGGGLCHSIDVHPQNQAILLRYQNQTDKITALHNMCRHYGGMELSSTKDLLPLPRGIATNLELDEPDGNREYIEEVCFSPCGRLIASPFGYGATIATYDQCFNDYEAHMMDRITDHNKCHVTKSSAEKDRKKRKTKSTETDSCMHLEPRCFHVVKTCFGHQSPVLSTCFSPRHVQLATGSEKGNILIHNPVL